MKQYETLQAVTQLFRAMKRVLLVGPRGVGKSDIVVQAAKTAGLDIILSHPAVEDPVDVRGFPSIENGVAKYVPYESMQRAIHADKPTVWFLDDFGQAAAATQAAYMQPILSGRLAEHAISPNVTYALATNRRRDRAGVSGVLDPVQDRFHAVIEVEPDAPSWATWASMNGIDPRVTAYVQLHPDHLLMDRGTEIAAAPSPRTWAYASQLVGLGLDPSMAVGPEVGSQFASFLNVVADCPNIDDVIKAGVVPELSNDLLHVVIAGLTSRLELGNWKQISKCVESMANREPWAVLLVRSAFRKIPSLDKTPEMDRIATGPIGAAILEG